jgi:hypothetical protein
MPVLCLSITLLFVLTPLTATLNSGIVYQPQYRYQSFVQPTLSLPATRQSQSVTIRPNQSISPRLLASFSVPVIHGVSRPDMIAAACAIFLLQIYLLMRLLYPIVRRANGLILLLIGLSWFGPLFADVLYYGMRDKEPVMDKFALYSPFGTMIQALNNPVSGTWQGVIGQGAICLFLAIIFFMVQIRRTNQHPTPIGLTTNL